MEDFPDKDTITLYFSEIIIADTGLSHKTHSVKLLHACIQVYEIILIHLVKLQLLIDNHMQQVFQ